MEITEAVKALAFKPEATALKNMFGKKTGRWSVTFCGWEGGGTSKQAAIADLRKTMEIAVRDDYSPKIFSWRGNAILMARHPVYGWGTKVIMHSGVDLQTQIVYLSSGNCHDQMVASNEALYHLAQMGWSHGEPVPEITPCDKWKDFESWAEFQNRYYVGKTVLGLSEDDARGYAGRNPARPELWSHEKEKERS